MIKAYINERDFDTSEFSAAEERGRKLTKEFLKQIGTCKALKFTKGTYTFFDCSFINKSTGRRYICEIKVRDLVYLHCDYHYMDERKYNKLADKVIGTHLGLFYFSFFGSNHLYIYDLRYCKPIEKQIECNQTTVTDSNRVVKDMVAFNPSDAIKYIKEDGNWIKIN